MIKKYLFHSIIFGIVVVLTIFLLLKIKLFIPSINGSLSSIINIVLLFWTGVIIAVYTYETMKLREESHRQVDMARMASEAADKSAKIAEKSLTLLERPWIDVSIEQPFKPTRSPQQIFLKTANTGRTPAKVKQQGFVVQWHTKMPEYPLDRKESKELPTDFIVHPGQSINSSLPIDPFSQQDMDDIIQGKQILAIYGSVLYDDIFDVRHITRFCRIYSRVRDDGIGNFILPYHARPEYNESD